VPFFIDVFSCPYKRIFPVAQQRENAGRKKKKKNFCFFGDNIISPIFATPITRKSTD
jgi:hypothetical protein